jgi:AhpD family alkylhydroperoxidase
MMMRTRFVAIAVAFVGVGSASAQNAPDFMTKTYPEQAIQSALEEMGALEGEDAALGAKTRELISLGVAAQIPCEYCIYIHTKAASSAGATEAEIREALAAAAQVRKWSTILNGSSYDMDAFRREVDGMLSSK